MVAHGGPQGPRFGSGILQSPRASILKSSSALDMAAVSWIVAPTSENMCGIRLVISLEADETSPLAQQEEPSSHGYDIRRIRRSPTKNKLFKHFLGDAGIQKKMPTGIHHHIQGWKPTKHQPTRSHDNVLSRSAIMRKSVVIRTQECHAKKQT